MKEGEVRAGIIVRSRDPLDSSTGMLVQADHLAARKPGAMGRVLGVVPGCYSGDVWWVKHGADDTAPYSYLELDLVAEPIPKSTVPDPGPLPDPHVDRFAGVRKVDTLILPCPQVLQPGQTVYYNGSGLASSTFGGVPPFGQVSSGLESTGLVEVTLFHPLSDFESRTKAELLELAIGSGLKVGATISETKASLVVRLRTQEILSFH